MNSEGYIRCLSCGASLPPIRFPYLSIPKHPQCFTCEFCLKQSYKAKEIKPNLLRRAVQALWN